MSTAAILRTMIDQRERELVALRDALEMMERDGGSATEGGVQSTHPSEPVEKINTAPAAGLYGEDGCTVQPAPMPRELRAGAMARHQEDIAARNDDLVIEAIREIGAQASVAAIAARTGLAQTSLKRVIGRLKDARRLDIVGWARGRRYVLLDDAGEPVTLPDRVAPRLDDTRHLDRKDSPRRRFTDHADLAPERVMGLADDHPAVVEGRTLFPSAVVTPDGSARVLIEGKNQRKLGDRVTKGAWAGMPIFALTLEERATCPSTCHHWTTCYGSGMQYARRNRAGPELEHWLDAELQILGVQYPDGFVVRLHILGDFYSVEYVERWARWLKEIPQLRVFGYTAWPATTEIGGAIMKLRTRMWDRFAIRTSVPADMILGRNPKVEYQPLATTIRRVAQGKQPEGIVCPAQTHDDVCCGSCGLCWSEAARETPIAFIVHGRKAKAPVPEPAAQPEPKPEPKRQPAAPRETWTPERVNAAQPPAPTPAARPPIPYIPTASDAQRRTEEQAQIEAFLARQGARRFESGLLLSMLEQAFAEDDIAFEPVHGQRENKGGRTPYRLAGKLVSSDHAIRHADVIRKRMGLPPIAAETMEAAE